jgi:4-azaleucine resistance transporter AzlC
VEIQKQDRLKQVVKGALAMLPLCFAIMPWGFLVGSFAIETGMTFLEGQTMSLVLFAGAGQLVAIGMLKAGASLTTMIVTIFFVTSRHFLYGLTLREPVSVLPLRWRLTLGFLLTDELFALCGQQNKEQFERWYAFGAGFSFYLSWNLATLIGLLVGTQIPDLQNYGLEFAVAATFIAIVVPTIQSVAVLLSAVTALLASVVLSYFHVEGALVISGLTGMSVGYAVERWSKA